MTNYKKDSRVLGGYAVADSCGHALTFTVCRPPPIIERLVVGSDTYSNQPFGQSTEFTVTYRTRSARALVIDLDNGEHAGWEASMTVVGRVAEPTLAEIVEGKILALPKHDFTHPQYGTVMSMLNEPLSCRLQAP